MGKTSKVKVKSDETKRERFIRLVNTRTAKTLRAMKLITNLASGNYEYNEQDIRNVLKALSKGILGISEAFSKKGVDSIEFSVEEREEDIPEKE